MSFADLALRRSRLAAPVLALVSFALGGCFEFSQPEDAGAPPVSGLEGQILVQGASAASADEGLRRLRAEIAAANGELPIATGDEHSSVNPTGRPGLKPAMPSDVRRVPREYDWRPGEIMVVMDKGRFTKGQLQDRVQSMLNTIERDDVRLEVTSCAAHILCLLTVTDNAGKLLDKEPTRELRRALEAVKVEGVRTLGLNGIKYAMRVPNDELYGVQQWHYEAARLPGAWDISTGDPNLIVAVIDTGLVINHPDIADRYIEGADMISDANIAGDGNGRDLDATDEGDQAKPGGESSWHGTHVAGTIAAESDNGDGAAGVTWQGKIQPIRVLGFGAQGAAFDILSGLYWAIGASDIEDLPDNQTPSRVVNMSLGGLSSPDEIQTWVEIVDDILNVGAAEYGYPILLTAAGNEDQNAANVTPANIPGMITIGAFRYDGQRASYSNYGDVVDIMGPGGEQNMDQNADGWPDAVLSLVATEYGFEQGTSMATPHVAGIAALLLSVDPELKQADVLTVLRQTADTTGVCNEGCGAGHVDATAALLQAGGVVAPIPQIALDRTQLFFPPDVNRLEANVINIGNGNLDFTVQIVGSQAALFSASPASGTLAPGGILPVAVDLSRDGYESGSANLLFEGQGEAIGQQVYVDLGFQDVPVVPAIQINTVQVGAYIQEANGYRQVGESVLTRSDQSFEWQILDLPPGNYYVFGIGDDNNDGVFDAQTESIGAWPVPADPKPLEVEANKLYVGINFALAGGYTVPTGLVGSACVTDADCELPDSICEDAWLGGYCTRVCTADGYCGPTGSASCEPLQCGDESCDVCLARCTSDSQCRTDEGYRCDAYNTCTPIGFSE